MSTKSENSIVSEVRFEKLVYGGDALARLEGQVLLAPFVLPGETARVSMTPTSKGLLRGHVVEVTQPAPERIAPECPVFTRCGGCHYQHTQYGAQLALKQEILRETLRRTAKIEAPSEIATIAGPPFGYRNRVQLHFGSVEQAPGLRRPPGPPAPAFDFEIGFHQAGSHDLCPIEQCPISSPRLNQAIASLRKMMRDRRWPRFLRSLELFTNESEVQINVLDSGDRHLQRGFFDWCAESMPGATATSLEYPSDDVMFRVSHKSFFQVNRHLLGPLVDTAIAKEAGESALDLYAGVGLFSLSLARRFTNVVAVESSASAVTDLVWNAQRAGLTVQAERQSAEQYLESLQQPPEFVLADPPRTGLGAAVVKQLVRLAPPRLTIVSCDPATLARDLASLTAAGYEIASLTLVDLFPQTCHIESVVALRGARTPACRVETRLDACEQTEPRP